jgi:hypothetical protein
MSQEMRDWCAERGEVISVALDPSCVVEKKQLDQGLIKHGESVYGEHVWASRLHWFKKPFALLHSPYKIAIWMDIDCEVLGSLTPLFSKLVSELALVRESPFFNLPFFHPDVLYNGGMIVFKHGSPFIQKWAQGALEMNHLFLGDDQLLSYLIYLHRFEIQELPEIYNWKLSQGLNLAAVVLHWVAGGKEYIRIHGGLKPLLDQYFGKPKSRDAP